MLRTILIVDDLMVKRGNLYEMLCNEYLILEAGNGEEAYAILKEEHNSISAIILDIMVLEQKEYDFLSLIRSKTETSHIPVIIITDPVNEKYRVRALTKGVNDFITAPDNADIIRHCLTNSIAISETSPLINRLSRDSLTGLYNRESFFEKVAQMVKEHKENYYVIACFDIDKFKVINDQYGTDRGDEVLKHIANVFKEGFEKIGGICCRIAADNFAVLYPLECQNSEEILKMRKRVRSIDGIVLPIKFSIGRYIINDLSLPPSVMFDRAMLAGETVKGRFDIVVADYNESMRGHLILEQEIVNEMVYALEDNQFEAWYQPQYNHFTGALIGSEALARWRHPTKGLIPPGNFIPVFEQNGFIYELDKFIWEDACRHLRNWIDKGLDPLPVSVNISRYDIFRDDFIYIINGLVKKYRIPVELLRIEVTESAFTQSASQIISVVRKLISLGFTVEIDDFGSGYSSLNTLKDVPAQVLKLDMKFLESTENSQRGGNIVESIVRMSKWLDMTVIAEGVETVRQADFLKSIGCNYIQGYLYAKPMPADEYEKLFNGVNKEERLLALETVEHLDKNSFWDPDSIDTLIFNSFVGGACVYEYCNGKVELIRATDKYAQVIGSAGMTVEDALKIDWVEHLDDKTRQMILSDLELSIDTKQEVTGEYVFLDLPGCPHKTYLRTTMRVIASAGRRYLVYCTNENITAQRKAEQKERRTAQQLEAIINSVDQGITATLLKNDEVQFLFANNRYYELLGYTKEQFIQEVKNPFMTIVDTDRQRALKDVREIKNSGKSAVYDYHVICRNGSRRYFRIASSIGMFTDVKEPVQLSIYRDITDVKQAERELLDNLPCGAALYEYDGENISVVYINRRYWELVKREPSDFVHNSLLDFIHPDDKQLVVDQLYNSIEQNREPSCDIRILYGDNEYRFFRLNGRIILKSDGLYSIYVAYTLLKGDEITI